MNIARRDGKLAAVPYFPMLKEDNVRTGFINRSDFIRLRDAMPEHLRPLVTFLYFTGCRVGAALSIRRSQIEFEDRRALLRLERNQVKNDEPNPEMVLNFAVLRTSVLRGLSRERVMATL